MRLLGLFLIPCLTLSLLPVNSRAQTLADSALPANLATQTATPDPSQPTTNPDEPITMHERFTWFVESTVGPSSLAGGTISAGFGTWLDRPKEYGTHWEGFGQRYGIRMSGIATSNAIEGGLGAIWGEDPRYYRDGADKPFSRRVGHVVKWTFVAPGRDGTLHPAYARFIAVAGNNFLSNAWREPSEADNSHAIERTGLGILVKMAGNTWDEFWPDAKRKMFHH